MPTDYRYTPLALLAYVGDIQEFSKLVKARSRRPKELLLSEICSLDGEKCQVLWTATPGMDLFSAQMILNKHDVSQLLVVSGNEDHQGYSVGLIHRECISLACRSPLHMKIEMA